MFNLLDTIELSQRTQLITDIQHVIQELRNKVIVIKYGGSTLEVKNFETTVLSDISILQKAGIKPIIIHGGGPSISQEAKIQGITPKFVDGHRVTDEKTLSLAEMILSGKINKNIVGKLNSYGIAAVGISGKDGKTMIAKKKLVQGKDIGYVGQIIKVNTKMVEFLLNNNYVPVISPIAIGEDNTTYSINADDVTASIAISTGADKVIFLTDVIGIIKDGKLLPRLTKNQVEELIQSGIIYGGMIPKIKAMLECFKGSVNKIYIVDGRKKHPIIGELFSSVGLGTLVTRD
jgi:acetylglutamate kinase